MAYSIMPEEVWVHEEGCTPEGGSSGGCADCGHTDGQDAYGTYMLDFWTPEEGGDVLCPECYDEARGIGRDGAPIESRRG
jgi:hypothetical protein